MMKLTDKQKRTMIIILLILALAYFIISTYYIQFILEPNIAEKLSFINMIFTVVIVIWVFVIPHFKNKKKKIKE